MKHPTIRHASAPPVAGCRWCGFLESSHQGTHLYCLPTTAQRIARRAAHLRAGQLPGQVTISHPTGTPKFSVLRIKHLRLTVWFIHSSPVAVETATEFIVTQGHEPELSVIDGGCSQALSARVPPKNFRERLYQILTGYMV